MYLLVKWRKYRNLPYGKHFYFHIPSTTSTMILYIHIGVDVAILMIIKLNMLPSVTTRYFMEEFEKQYPSRGQNAWV